LAAGIAKGETQVKLLGRFRQSPAAAAAFGLYRSAVEQSRQPAFYRERGVPDTVDGRFDMICLHVALILWRLKQEHARTAECAQELFDVMFADMDQNLREMGVGDMSVGKRVRAMAQAFYGRLAAYDAALAAEDDADLAAALRRNLFRKCQPRAGDVAAMAEYTRQEAVRLSATAADGLLAGDFSFAAPAFAERRDSGERGR
jgi:cytochrome b pre-mRNA-processing protein 3